MCRCTSRPPPRLNRSAIASAINCVTGKPVRRIAARLAFAWRRRGGSGGNDDLVAVLRALPPEPRSRTAAAVVTYFRACAGRAGILGRLVCRSHLDGLDAAAQAEAVLRLVAAYGWRV
jgi:hypothetical protein